MRDGNERAANPRLGANTTGATSVAVNDVPTRPGPHALPGTPRVSDKGLHQSWARFSHRRGYAGLDAPLATSRKAEVLKRSAKTMTFYSNDPNRYAEDFDTWCRFYDPDKQELRIARSLVSFAGKRTLEVGCGTGRFSFQIVPLVGSLTAVDIRPDVIRWCRAKQRTRRSWGMIDFQVSDVQDLPFLDGQFDLIIDTWTFSTVKDRPRAASEYHRVLRTGGKLLAIQAGERSDYQKLIARFLPKSRFWNSKSWIERPLSKVFGSPSEKTHLNVPYVFPTAGAARETLMFDLRSYKEVRTRPSTGKRLNRAIAELDRTRRGVELNEAVDFYLFEKHTGPSG